jgi:hypothetical protein
MACLPVIMASAASSLGSLSTIRDPGAIVSLSISDWETSRLIGIENRVPSLNRSFSTTLLNANDQVLLDYIGDKRAEQERT